MQIAVNRTVRKLKQVSIDASLAWLTLLVLLTMLLYRGFMALQSSRLNDKIAQKQEELLQKTNELKTVQQHPWYLKLLAAKYLESETKTVSWEKSIKYLTSLLEELKAYNKQQKSVNLANFQIDNQKITLQWSVSGIKDIYAEWWIIDRFSGYPFVKFFRLPYFRLNQEGGYEFLLDADIYHYDWTEPTS